MKRVTAKGSSGPLNQQSGDLPKLSAPAQRALAAAGVQSLKQLSKFSEKQVKQWHGIGPNALNQLRKALHANDLSFASENAEKT